MVTLVVTVVINDFDPSNISIATRSLTNSFEPAGLLNKNLGFSNPHLGVVFSLKAADAVDRILRRDDPDRKSIGLRQNVVLNMQCCSKSRRRFTGHGNL
jgi:hypothetical protein